VGLPQTTPHSARPSADGRLKMPAAGHPLPRGEGRRAETDGWRTDLEVRAIELYARSIAYRRGVVKRYFRGGGTPEELWKT